MHQTLAVVRYFGLGKMDVIDALRFSYGWNSPRSSASCRITNVKTRYPFDQTIGFGSDSCSSMIGKRNG